MPVMTTYTRFSNIVPVGGVDLRLSELALSVDGVSADAITSVTASVAPTTGSLANLSDINLATEAHWSAAGGMPSITLATALQMGIRASTHARQGSGSVVNEQIASATIEISLDEADWTTIHIGALSAAGAINTDAAWTALAVVLQENLTDTAGTTESLEDNLFFLTDSAAGADVSTNQLGASNAATDTATSAETIVRQYGYLNSQTDSAAAADILADSTFTMYLEAIGLSDSLVAGANTTAAYADTAAMLDVIQQAINQIVADSANGADSFNLGAALALVDIADAVATQTSSVSATLLVAELIATLEAYNGADGYDIAETGTLSDAYVARVEALVAMLEAAQAVDTDTALVHVMQSAADSADGTTTITSAGSLLNALLNDAVLATIRLNIGGELFTGWVLNTDTMAPSEYQFADRQFNSACKHGDRYLMAAEDGIYEFTEDTSVETVMTYIKTGKTDFVSYLKKRIVNSYMVYSASGDMVLKVTTSEYGNLVTRNYRVVAQEDDTTDVRRVDIGRGIKSRYWQFELVGDGVDCNIDEIGMLPVVLSRRI